MEFQHEVFSKALSEDEYNDQFEEIIQVIDNNNHNEVEILFGVAWGNVYKNWTSFRVPVKNVAQEIHSAEQFNVGKFGDDDFYIIINEIQTEILFCHEKDIHLRYNQENTVIEEILKRWEVNGLIKSAKTKTG